MGLADRMEFPPPLNLFTVHGYLEIKQKLLAFGIIHAASDLGHIVGL